jgi:hypothetical protein
VKSFSSLASIAARNKDLAPLQNQAPLREIFSVTRSARGDSGASELKSNDEKNNRCHQHDP